MPRTLTENWAYAVQGLMRWTNPRSLNPETPKMLEVGQALIGDAYGKPQSSPNFSQIPLTVVNLPALDPTPDPAVQQAPLRRMRADARVRKQRASNANEHGMNADYGRIALLSLAIALLNETTPARADVVTDWNTRAATIATRTFRMPGVVAYHDEVSHATGVIIVQEEASFAIGPGVTGAWYDPSQSGHGLFIEVLPSSRFYASWFAFNPAGTQQAWFTGVGSYSGNTATITAVELPTGGRWIPNFDPDQLVRNAWGTLTFTFTDCAHGTVNFDSVLGYGAGSMNLTRLTQPAGLHCP